MYVASSVIGEDPFAHDAGSLIYCKCRVFIWSWITVKFNYSVFVITSSPAQNWGYLQMCYIFFDNIYTISSSYTLSYYSALSISRDHFFYINHERHPIVCSKSYLRICCIECNIVFYCTAIYREYIVSDNQENLGICLCYEFRTENSDIYLFRLYLFMAYYHIAKACLQIQGSRWNIWSMMTMQYPEGISFVHICLIFMEWMLFHTREFGLRITYTALPVDN